MLPILTSYSKGQGRKGAIKYDQSDIKIGIKQDSSRSKFSVTEDGFYFVSLSASTEHFGNEGVHLKIDKVSTSGEESHLVSPMLDHEAESENGYSGGGVVTRQGPRFSIRMVIGLFCSDTETGAVTPPGVMQKK